MNDTNLSTSPSTIDLTLSTKSIRRLAFVLMLGVTLLAISACSGVDTTATDCSIGYFEVTTTIDINDGLCNSHCSLREAVIAANTCTDRARYEIRMPPGNHVLSLRGPDERGDLNVTSAIDILGSDETFISGEDTWIYRLFDVSPSGDLLLRDLALWGGNSPTNGGAILNQGALSIDNASLHSNSTDGAGGAIYNLGSAQLRNADIRENSANLYYPRGCGGAIYNEGGLSMDLTSIFRNNARNGHGICNEESGHLTIRTSDILRNGTEARSSNDKGGGIFDAGTFMLIEDSVIEDNEASEGGGVYAQGPDITITGTEIVDNKAWFGGGLYASPEAHGLRIVDTIFRDNDATSVTGRDRNPYGGIGGGLFLSSDEFDISDSQIIDNVAEFKGGGVMVQDNTSTLNFIAHTAIARNSVTDPAEGNGGGMFIQNGNILIVNVTISGNFSRRHGSAYYNGVNANTRFLHVTISDHDFRTGESSIYKEAVSELSFKNTLVVENNYCGGDFGSGVSLGGNYLQWLCDDIPLRTDDLNPAVVSPADIGILPLAEDSGTLVHPLPPPSDAVDFVESFPCNRDDQRHVDRPQGALCDIGAYETSAETLSLDQPPIVIGTPTPDGPSTVTIITTTPCYSGPGPQYGFVNNLASGISAQLVGAGFTGNGNQDWLVASHPTAANTNCWLDSDDVTPSIPFSEMRLITIPDLPTPTPKPTSDRPPPQDEPDPCYYNQQQQWVCP